MENPKYRMAEIKKYGHIYVRVSGNEQAETGNSIENQKAQCREYAARHGIIVKDIYLDPAITGRTMKRPQLIRLQQTIMEGEHIIAYSVSRLNRTVKDFIGLIEWAEKRSITIHTVKEAIDTKSAYGVFLTVLFSGLAQLEANMTQERMAELNTRKIRRGETTKAPPFGYRSVKYAIGSPARLIPDPVEQGAITRMFSLRFQEQFRQMSLRQIAEKLTQEGHRPRRSTAFTGESIRQILSREYEFRMRVHGTLNIPESLIQRYVDLCMPFIVPSSQIERYLMTDKTGRVTYNGMYEDTSQEIEKIQFFSVKQGAKRKKRALPETATILDLHLMLLDQEKETERLARHIIDQETMSRRSVADIESKEFRKLLEMVITSEMRLDSKMSGVRVSLSEDLKTAEIRYRIHIEEKSIVEGYNEMNDSIALEMRLNVMQLKRKLDQYAPKKVPTAMPVKG